MCEIGVICARILGCEIPPQGDDFGCNLNEIPNALDRLVHWVETRKFPQKNGGAVNVARCIEVEDEATSQCLEICSVHQPIPIFAPGETQPARCGGTSGSKAGPGGEKAEEVRRR